MIRLLSAEFTRLWKDKLFWICIIFNIGYALLYLYDTVILNRSVRPESAYSIDAVFFNYLPVMMIIVPVFTAMFIGTEYSNGTVRNKVVIGHRKLAVYMSDFIVCAAANILITMAFIIIFLSAGIPLLGVFSISNISLIVLIALSFLSIIALTSIIAAIAMLTQSKAGAAVSSIIAVLLIFAASSIMIERLNEPEEAVSYVIITEDGVEMGDPEPNPLYVSGTTRTVFEFFADFLPTGQAIQISNLDIERYERFWYFSLILMTVSMGAGCMLYNRKDLR